MYIIHLNPLFYFILFFWNQQIVHVNLKRSERQVGSAESKGRHHLHKIRIRPLFSDQKLRKSPQYLT